ncbi:43 kDa receptor-associated protein of the synapse isoform X2 [Lucilia cuprina]|uniref:43 kDa receptor-associated protein of the synapse isoform X2 n=1 Tax=Lucilia cuprina TaxID=7375 RepID=UPI001F0666F4|nr:43 kDa receptor-associated protein of the synapse isoform X2 [Lucilia cuprina]
MSWESIANKDLLSIPHSHNLSATHLLASPDGSRYLLNNTNEFCQLDESYSRLAGCGSSPDGTSLWARHGYTRSNNSVINCFLACQRSLKQFMARRKIERGLKLYEQHNQNAAVRTWRSALKSTSRREDCFQLLGYLYQAHMDWGKYREAIEFGHQQLGISEELDSPTMRAETYLNLARAHERLGGLERALSYARHSLYNECGTQCRTGGLVHLTVARVYLEMGGFSRAFEGLQGAYKIATAICDPSLELQVYVALSELYGRLQDNEKSASYASKAYDLSRSLQLGDLNSSHHRAALLRMAVALRKQGDLGDAHDYCMEATRLSMISGDQATYMRSIRIMGDIYRKKMDYDRALRQYEQAMGNSASLGDRMAQMEAMDGAARCLEALRLQQKICNCRPLEFNTRLLEVASSIGAKLLVRKIRRRLALIYRALGDEEQYNTHIRLANQTDSALGLNCGACGEVFGLEPDSLEALPCAHILHARCAQELIRRKDKGAPRACPACNKVLSSRLHLCSTNIDGSNNSSSTLNPNSLARDSILATMDSHNDLFTLQRMSNTNPSSAQVTLINNPSASIVKTCYSENTNIYGGLKQQPPQQHSNAESTSLLLANNSNSPRPVYRSNLSLASLSLRASNLTIDSSRNATSSV